MEALTRFTVNDVFVFSLIFIRMSGLCVVAPMYGGEQIPRRVRILFAFGVTFLLYPILTSHAIAMPQTVIEYAVLIFKELGVGMLIGFSASALFFGFQVGAQIIAIDMGLQMANMIDPMSDVSITAIGTVMNGLLMTVFLVCDGHHFVLKALIDSFHTIPLTKVVYSAQVFQQSIDLFNIVLVTAFKIAAPSMVALLAVSLVFAFVARLVPQMNVFILALPVKIAIGLLILIVVFPLMISLFYSVMEQVFSMIYRVMALF
jgi:flagellar biosynthesis protein FliR